MRETAYANAYDVCTKSLGTTCTSSLIVQLLSLLEYKYISGLAVKTALSWGGYPGFICI